MILCTDHGIGDAPTSPDYSKAKAAGVGVAAIKGYQDPYGHDAAYARDVSLARAAGLTVQTYIFPNCHGNAAFPKQQVASWLATRPDIRRGADLPPAIDAEFPGGVPSYGLPKATIVETLRQFVLEIQDQLGVSPAIYTAQTQWWDLGLPSAPWAAECLLWLKTAYRLDARHPPDPVIPPRPHFGPLATDPRDYYRAPDPWKNTGWYMQQFQGDALGFPGFPRTVDLNYFHEVQIGDTDPLVKWIQRRLKVVADGVYGPATQAAIEAFQLANMVDARDGSHVDPATLAALAWA